MLVLKSALVLDQVWYVSEILLFSTHKMDILLVIDIFCHLHSFPLYSFPESSLPCNSQNALKVVNCSSPLHSSTNSAVAPTK